ncbi:poly(rC)-binding protein 3 isoform X4 [Stomoxys calcitrans]|uniref:K Homology domain-containing protein n=1 Tax=Stomoxys calcitrans TaxID=35570 RepID=A0A1I8NW21_STOCA|nr:poly(rC)-binding protein 3 isoform X4 [Stomoxys calcitrans]
MEDNNTSTQTKHDDPSVTLTIRLIMQGKEVGSIIGKKGEIVNRFREESGAKINISDGSCPERIVTVSGTTSAIYSAFTLITKKFEEWCSQFNNDVNKGGKTQIPIRLIVPASQCGSLIGKSGSKIKEIRQTTGCSIQVASEMLPNSTERAVTLSGTAEQITQCIYQICLVMLESPPRGATIPYRPKPQVSGPVILANGQAFTIQGNYAVPAQEVAKNPLASLAALGLAGMAPANTGGLNPTALAALAGSQLRTANTNRAQQQQHEMTVSNDLIGCIIGKGGTKIAEIRQISGAMIRISNCEEREGGNTDRTITISGNPDSVALAQYLINMSVELQMANLQEANNAAAITNGTTTTATANGGQTNTNSQTNSSNGNSTTATTTTPPTNNNSNTTSNTNSSAALVATLSNNTNISNTNTTTTTASNDTTTTSVLNSANPLAAAASSLATAIPLAQLLAKPGALNALTSLTALGSLSDLLGGLATLGGPPVQTTGVNRTKSFASSRFRNHNADGSAEPEKARNKFNPY